MVRLAEEGSRFTVCLDLLRLVTWKLRARKDGKAVADTVCRHCEDRVGRDCGKELVRLLHVRRRRERQVCQKLRRSRGRPHSHANNWRAQGYLDVCEGAERVCAA